MNEEFGASAHTDYGMITLLACDGVRGLQVHGSVLLDAGCRSISSPICHVFFCKWLQICREKDEHPRVWEDVPHLDG